MILNSSGVNQLSYNKSTCFYLFNKYIWTSHTRQCPKCRKHGNERDKDSTYCLVCGEKQTTHTKFQVVWSAMRNKGWCAGKKGNFRQTGKPSLMCQDRNNTGLINRVRVYGQIVSGRGRDSIKAPRQVQRWGKKGPCGVWRKVADEVGGTYRDQVRGSRTLEFR